MKSPHSPTHLVSIAVLYLLGGFFTWMFYIRFWKWRDCIRAAKSSCIPYDGENLTHGGAIWSIPASFFLFAGSIYLAWYFMRLQKSRRSEPKASTQTGKGISEGTL